MQLVSDMSLIPLFPLRLPVVLPHTRPPRTGCQTTRLLPWLYSLLKQAHARVREIHARVARHENTLLTIAIEDIGGHIGMGDLLDGQSVAPITAKRVADNAGSEERST